MVLMSCVEDCETPGKLRLVGYGGIGGIEKENKWVQGRPYSSGVNSQQKSGQDPTARCEI